MARGLQCPACGERHRIDGAAPGSTFKCGGCARTLRVPGSPVTSVEHGGASAPSASISAPPETQRQPSEGSNRIHLPPYEGDLPLAARIVSWVIAIPVAGFISLKIAVLIGLLSTNDLIDLITGSGGGRYLRMVIFIPLWALVTAGVVSLILEVGERLLANYGKTLSSANPERSTSTRARNLPKDVASASNASPPQGQDRTRVNASVIPDRPAPTPTADEADPQRPRRIPPR
ncbi:hypothetical protein IMCC26256_111408 [Actinobacteria bacterium IMCC26256]|nr:hypothetical protein IMCC26256_111408 [Actinobacteria bacterium IMCC26256]